jgi:hypothetical protein
MTLMDEDLRFVVLLPNDHMVGARVQDLIVVQNMDGANVGIDTKDAFLLDQFAFLGHVRTLLDHFCVSTSEVSILNLF